jgi:hypothetical protein
MIKITPSATYTTPVQVELPADLGKVEKVVFTAQFRRLSLPEIENVQQRMSDGALNDDTLVRDVMVGWGKDVIGDDGQPLEFNDANLTALLNIFPVRPQIVRKFFETITGAKAKN